jgi:hypothetical protein
MKIDFDHLLWHKANQMCRGDKVHNIQIAMTCYRSNFKLTRKQPFDINAAQSTVAWHGILNNLVNSA